MKTLLAIVSLIFTVNAFAQGAPVPHEFANGNAIVASEFNANFQELSNRNKNSKDQIDQNTADIDALEASVSTLQATTSQNSASIADAQTNVSDAQATASQNASNINSVESALSTAQGSLSQNTADIVTLNTNIASIDGTVTQIQADLSNLQSSSGSQPLPQFVGKSSGTIDGAQGIRAMTELCQVDYPQSRMCTTEEYAKTIAFPPSVPAAVNGWVLPTEIVRISDIQMLERYVGDPITASANSGNYSCQGWTTIGGSAYTAITVSESGKFTLEHCSNQLSVSCCK